MIIVGIDPDTIFPADEATSLNLILLPEAVPASWQGLKPNQIESRLLTLLAQVEADLIGLPFLLPPYSWLSEIMRERHEPARRVRQVGKYDRSELGEEGLRQVSERIDTPSMSKTYYIEPASSRHGFVPAWVQAARQRTGLKGLLPPDPVPGRRPAKARSHKLDCDKGRIHKLWLEWRFGESSHRSRAKFASYARNIARLEHLDDKTILKWIGVWERDARVSYGKYHRSCNEICAGEILPQENKCVEGCCGNPVFGCRNTYDIYAGYPHPAMRILDRKKKLKACG